MPTLLAPRATSCSWLGVVLALTAGGCTSAPRHVRNPVLDGWYADPEGVVLAGRYWIFPTLSAPYDDQTYFDAFSSPDLVTWTKHPRVLETSRIAWAHRALWAPSVVERDGRYFLFFAANDLQRPGGPLWDPHDARSHTGGIGVAVADRPEGPYRDHLGRPLVDGFHNDAQPIDPFVFRDGDGTHYLFHGGWGRCNVAILDETFTGFRAWPDGSTFRDITPEGYVEGPTLFVRDGRYYFLWSEGGWGNASYRVAYAIGDGPGGPFRRIGTILEQDPAIATGAGHNSVLRAPHADEWYIVYHRRPIPNQGRDHRVTCIDRLSFDAEGRIEPVVMTFDGPPANPLR